MSNPTTPFSWQMPTATDLVTDLPADFEVFGQAVATSMADLLGGTSGQILAKNSNTDMDFVWTTPNPGDITGVTAGVGISGGGTSGDVTITNSMATEITAKGDLIVGTGSATFDNLAAGANGSTIVADSSTSTGLRYTAGNPIPNPIINSAMQVWQRTTSLAATTSLGNYAADRWMCRVSSTVTNTFSRQLTSDTTNLPNIQYCMRIQRTAGQTATPLLILEYSQETVNSIPYAGKAVTMSFYARAGANFSASGNAFTARLKTGTGTDQNIGSTYTGEATTIDASATLTTTWQRFSYTGTVAASATEMGLQCFYTATGTAGAADYMEVTGFQIDIGSVALPYRTNGATIQGELAACQRYFVKYASAGSTPFTVASFFSTTQADGVIGLPVQMRTAPTLSSSGDLRVYDFNANFNSISTLVISDPDKLTVGIRATTTGGTQYRPARIQAYGDATAFVAFSAEL